MKPLGNTMLAQKTWLQTWRKDCDGDDLNTNRKHGNELPKGFIWLVCMYVLFNVVIQQQTASQEKSAKYLVFYMLIRTHEV